MIYTSYFNKVKNLNDNYKVVGITRFPPKNIINCFFVAPSKDLLIAYKNNLISQEQYAIEYMKQLNNNKNNIMKLVEYLNQYNNDKYKHIVMCCYEKSQDFCHRHILSKYLMNFDLNVSELGDVY